LLLPETAGVASLARRRQSVPTLRPNADSTIDANVRFGSLAAATGLTGGVRFTPESCRGAR